MAAKISYFNAQLENESHSGININKFNGNSKEEIRHRRLEEKESWLVYRRRMRSERAQANMKRTLLFSVMVVVILFVIFRFYLT